MAKQTDEKGQMPRSVRVEYDGAIYHVMSRGDHGEKVFTNDRDRICFLETLVKP